MCKALHLHIPSMTSSQMISHMLDFHMMEGSEACMYYTCELFQVHVNVV